MKTERRQELKTNDLGAFLVELNDWSRKYAYHIGGVVGVVVIAVLVVGYARRSQRESNDALWQQLASMSIDIDNAEESFAEIDRLIEKSSDRDFTMFALMDKATNARTFAMMVRGFHPEFLDPAEDAYRKLLEQFPERTEAVGAALAGLAWVEENRFVMDADMSRRDTTVEYLERLQNEPRFKETTFQTIAAKKLAQIDETFRVVNMAEPLELPPAPPPMLESSPAGKGNDADTSPSTEGDSPSGDDANTPDAATAPSSATPDDDAPEP